jgi:fatty acid CoA ligase FadD9
MWELACGKSIPPSAPRFGCCEAECTENAVSFDLCGDCAPGHTREIHAKRAEKGEGFRDDEKDFELIESTGTVVLRGFASAAETLENRLLVFCTRRAFGRNLSYKWVHERAQALIHRLDELDENTGKSVAICAPNSALWFVADSACVLSGRLSVPIQPGLSDEDTRYILRKARPDVILTDDVERFESLVESLVRRAGDSDDNGRNEDGDDDNGTGGAPLTSCVVDINELTILPFVPCEIVPRAPKDPATIIWTSGSTGFPKGAVIADTTLRSHIGTAFGTIGGAPTVQFSYRPLALGSERFMYLSTIGNGGRIWVNDPELDFWQQVRECRPTMFSAPPRLFSQLFDEYHDSPEDARRLFGDRCESMTTGGAPTPPHVMKWLKELFGGIIHESYGTTEGGGIASDGVLSSNIVIKLVDVPDMGYLGTDLPFPRGELWIKNAHVISGYLHDAEKSREALTGDGFYCTGDIVEYDETTRRIQVIDRVKSFLKLSTSQFIAPERIEMELVAIPGISQVLVAARSDQAYPVCIIIGSCALEDLAVSTLLPHEIPRAIHFEEEPWTIANGGLTPSYKLARKRLLHKYRKVIDDLYAQPLDSAKTLRAFVAHSLADSISAVNFMHRMKRELNLEIPKHLLFGSDNVDEIVALLEGHGVSEEQAEVNWEKELEPVAASSVLPFKTQRILLTGATGFLGSHLLEALLRDPNRSVVCVVRGSSSRLQETMERYELDWDASRVEIIPSNSLDQVAVDAVVHCAARVNGVCDYSVLREPNVDFTKDLLRLGAPMAFISTLSVIATNSGSEATKLNRSWLPHMKGYGASKMVAEELVRTSNVPHMIFRPGTISSGPSGVLNENDYLYKLLKTCQQLGVAPDIDSQFPMVPADYVAESIVQLFDDEANLGRVFHFFNGANSPNVRDFATRVVPFVDFRERIRGDPSTAMYPIQNYLEKGWSEGGNFSDDETVRAVGRPARKVNVAEFRL